MQTLIRTNSRALPTVSVFGFTFPIPSILTPGTVSRVMGQTMIEGSAFKLA